MAVAAATSKLPPTSTVPILAPRATTTTTTPPVTATPIYIDLVDGYKALPPCAVLPLSTIVRDMQDGCGDGGRLTSYSCFCTNSYSRFSWQISTAVLRNCPDADHREEMATSAVGVFRGYCTSGREQLTAVVSSASEGADGAVGSGTTSTASFQSVVAAQETQSSNTSKSRSVSLVTAAAMMLVVLAARSSCIL
ncbi:hypothetical protein V8F33_013314 [Rhypophila sp. PSN 637]